jgi:hypothetical protein
MTTLRPSQIETLSWLRLHTGTEGAHAATLGPALGITPWAARKRLIRLLHRRCVASNLDSWSWEEETFRLTNKGRSELGGGS